jgi:hypothetical protein
MALVRLLERDEAAPEAQAVLDAGHARSTASTGCCRVALSAAGGR